MLATFLDRLGAFVRANLATCITVAAVVTAAAIYFNVQSDVKNSVWGHVVALAGLCLGTFIMVLSSRGDAAADDVNEDDLFTETPEQELETALGAEAATRTK